MKSLFSDKILLLFYFRLLFCSIPIKSFRALLMPRLCNVHSHTHSHTDTTNNKALNMRFVVSNDDILLSIGIFRKLYGHANIPQNFIIPYNISSNWPKTMSGLKLGQRANSIRKSFKKGIIDANMILKLKELDFSWHVFDSKFEYICKLLPIYLQLHSNLEMPYSYIINASESTLWPTSANGFKLGHRVHGIRNGLIFTSEEHRKAFHELKLLEHLKINILDQPRYRRPEKNINFNIKNIKTIEIDKISLFEILHSFYQIFHSFRIPKTFFVFDNDIQWPIKYWNQPIGRLLHELKRTYISVNNNSNTINNIDLVNNFEIQNLLKVNSMKTFQFYRDYYLLITYLQHHPSLKLLSPNTSYIIPHDNTRWPIFTYDINLTQLFSKIQSSKLYYQKHEYKNKLEQLPGFKWTLKDKQINIQTLRSSLKIFQTIYGINTFPSKQFIIPSQTLSSLWDPSTGGFLLGSHILKICLSKSRSSSIMQQKGIIFEYLEAILKKSNQEINNKQENDSTLLVSNDNYINNISNNKNKNLEFDNNIASMPYLTQLYDYLNNALNEQDSQLDQKKTRIKSIEKFRRIVLALLVHFELFGDYLVPRYFIVPEEPPWPKETWGMQLGNRVRNIRHGKAYNKKKYHEQLNKIGFLMDLEGYRITTNFNKNYD